AESTGAALAAEPVGFLRAALFQWMNPTGWLVAVGAAGTFLNAQSEDRCAQAIWLGHCSLQPHFRAVSSGLCSAPCGAVARDNARIARGFNAIMGAALACGDCESTAGLYLPAPSSSLYLQSAPAMTISTNLALELDGGVVHTVALPQHGFDGRSNAIAVVHVHDARVQRDDRLVLGCVPSPAPGTRRRMRIANRAERSGSIGVQPVPPVHRMMRAAAMAAADPHQVTLHPSPIT